MELSIAAVASPLKAYQHAYQDWPGWLSNNLLDTVIPMSYTRDLNQVRREVEFAVKRAKLSKTNVLAGLGAWLLKNSPSRFAKQAQAALDEGADGITLFSYSNLLPKTGSSPIIDEISSRVILTPK
jgi:uncharacterized lipoprotein YddW (UPF0748 family)